jgi:hypothetical protein
MEPEPRRPVRAAHARLEPIRARLDEGPQGGTWPVTLGACEIRPGDGCGHGGPMVADGWPAAQRDRYRPHRRVQRLVCRSLARAIYRSPHQANRSGDHGSTEVGSSPGCHKEQGLVDRRRAGTDSASDRYEDRQSAGPRWFARGRSADSEQRATSTTRIGGTRNNSG